MGSLFVTSWVGRRLRWRQTVPIITSLMILNALGWAAAWIPRVAPTWVRVNLAASGALTTIQRMIPHDAALIAPQAVIGRFANRVAVYPMMANIHFRLAAGRPNYVLLAPYQGVHLSSVSLMARELGDLADSHRASLIYYDHGVYLWRIRGSAPLVFGPRKTLPAWAFGTQTGAPVVGSTPKHWYVAGLGNNGNIIDQAYWRKPNGTYHVAVTISGWGPAQIQVWDATTGHLVANRYVTLSNGRRVTESYPFVFNTTRPSRPYGGWGWWRTDPVPGSKNNQLEVRVYAQASSMVNVYTVGLVSSP